MITTLSETATVTKGAGGDQQRVTTFMSAPVQLVITGLSNVAAPITEAGGQQDVPLGVSGLLSDEAHRAAIALQGHIKLIEGVAGWKRVAPSHDHPQLLSEPDD